MLVFADCIVSVDDVTDAIIQRVIRQKFGSHTIIAIAHKLDSILDFDRVAVLDNGCLKEFEDPHELLAQPSSAFYRLYYGADNQQEEESEDSDSIMTTQGS